MAASVVGFGRANPFQFRLGGGTSTVDVIHQSLLDAFDPGFDVSDTSAKAADAYIIALAVAMCWTAGNRLGNQMLPSKMVDTLDTWCEILDVRVAPGVSDYVRRSIVASNLRGQIGNTIGDIEDAGSALLGPNDSVVVFPHAPADEWCWWPGINPGPPGLEWASNRSTLRVQVAPSVVAGIGALPDNLQNLLDAMLPVWMNYAWSAGSGPFLIGVSQLDEATI